MPDAALRSPSRRRTGRTSPWTRAIGVGVLLALLTVLLGPMIPRAVAASIERTLTRRLPAPLGAYPDMEALGTVAREQLAGPKPGTPTLVWTSRTYRGDTNGWAWMRIAGDGRIGTGRELWNYARQGGSSPYYGARFDPRAVQALLDRLGPSVTPPPPIDRALFVSFARNGVWTTRVYDRTAPPDELVRAERLAGVWASKELSKNFPPTWMQAGTSPVPSR